jgi:hypothetical protein
VTDAAGMPVQVLAVGRRMRCTQCLDLLPLRAVASICDRSLRAARSSLQSQGRRRHIFFLLHALDDVLALAQEAIASAHVFCHCCATCM